MSAGAFLRRCRRAESYGHPAEALDDECGRLELERLELRVRARLDSDDAIHLDLFGLAVEDGLHECRRCCWTERLQQFRERLLATYLHALCLRQVDPLDLGVE